MAFTVLTLVAELEEEELCLELVLGVSSSDEEEGCCGGGEVCGGREYSS